MMFEGEETIRLARLTNSLAKELYHEIKTPYRAYVGGTLQEYTSYPPDIFHKVESIPWGVEGTSKGLLGEMIAREVLSSIFYKRSVRLAPSELDSPGLRPKTKGVWEKEKHQPVDILISNSVEVDGEQAYIPICGVDITLAKELSASFYDKINRTSRVEELEMPVITISLSDLTYHDPHYDQEIGIDDYLSVIKRGISNNEYTPLWNQDPESRRRWEREVAKKIVKGIAHAKNKIDQDFHIKKKIRPDLYENLVAKLKYVEEVANKYIPKQGSQPSVYQSQL